MININIDKSINKIILTTNDPSVKCLLEFKRKVNQYIPWIKKWGEVEVIDKIYDNKRPQLKDNTFKFVLGLGWTAYIANVLKNSISKDDYFKLLSVIMADNYRTYPFPGLRDYQNQDVLHILKYKIGLVTVNTGYGKYK